MNPAPDSLDLPPGSHIHVVGVAGVGMSALAQLLLDLDFRVTGSDRFLDQGESVPVLGQLERAGVVLVPQDGRAVCPGSACVVVSTAIEDDNPDLFAARSHSVGVVHRAALLADLCSASRLVAVTGTAGKTTVTGMIGWLLERCGMDPTVVNGGGVVNWLSPDRAASVRKGAGEWWVVEADESDRSLLSFRPDIAVITNASKDHFPLEEVHGLFVRFADRCCGSILVGPGLSSIPGMERAEEVPGGVEAVEGGYSVAIGEGYASVPLAGKHNAANTGMALAVCRQLGCSDEQLAEHLGSFRGIERRLERVGESNGAVVIDDYAHNPSKISAAWTAVAPSSGRVMGVWRPHGFSPLNLMFDELVEAFVTVCQKDDCLFLLPVFYAGGTAKGSPSSDEVARALRARGVNVEVEADFGGLERRLRDELGVGDTLLVMGARDPGLPRFARRMCGR